ncbi:DUF262 domain-containing protein [Roseibium sp. CAU 1637]|uniref:DUF262 domain-containing protein n=1 Tax=Roseibium limicola TaxID=2816037 RepID=A0A939EMZ5_9HYPH|nr:DUF262 domain-containing protein [Roseibium limicola]MBO0344852.1 DUF262 domain-containing protein [Roseibium limicola]
MANRVVLDAMIRRADFALQSESISVELGNTLKLSEITGASPTAKFLRKPDFQRETNHWTTSQVVNLIRSFVSGELIPALILWKSESFVFVIDGAHRLSALKAWVENDYGAGSFSNSFFSQSVQEEQRKIADKTRKAVEKEVGRYADYLALTEADLESNAEKARIHSIIFSRSLHVQWVQGNQEVAETSFFKINSQGTVLDKTEELLLKNRQKSYAIAARSIVRSGTGHKYWSKFEIEVQKEIEYLSSRQNEIYFQPFVDEPIKTLDLPVGGASSPVDALKSLIDLFALVDGNPDTRKQLQMVSEDPDGSETISLLKRSLRVANRVSGNAPGSLGLHPAVYFYTERGKHSRFLFLGIIRVIADALRNNDKDWFKKFTSSREKLEKTFLERKSLINQGLANVNSAQRVDRVAKLFRYLVEVYREEKEVSDNEILLALGLEGAAGNLQIIDAPKGFTNDVKSAAYLQAAIVSAPRCSICKGYLHVIKSVSYDHIHPVSHGGAGSIQNAQLVHPYCNTAIKGDSGAD